MSSEAALLLESHDVSQEACGSETSMHKCECSAGTGGAPLGRARRASRKVPRRTTLATLLSALRVSLIDRLFHRLEYTCGHCTWTGRQGFNMDEPTPVVGCAEGSYLQSMRAGSTRSASSTCGGRHSGSLNRPLASANPRPADVMALGMCR